MLSISSVDASGNVTCEFPGGATWSGHWNDDQQTLMLVGYDPNSRQPIEVLTGYLFRDPVNLFGVSGSVFFTLVGITEIFYGNGTVGPAPSAKCSTFAWYAQIGVD